MILRATWVRLERGADLGGGVTGRTSQRIRSSGLTVRAGLGGPGGTTTPGPLCTDPLDLVYGVSRDSSAPSPPALRLTALRATSRRSSVQIVLISVLAFSATDWPLGLLSEFWTDHPLTVSILSGLLLLAFAAFLVESFVQELEGARRKRIVVMSFRALAQEVKDVRTRLSHFVTGDDPAAVGVEVDASRVHATRTLLQRHPEVGQLPQSDWGRRLGVLLDDEEWVGIFLNGIREAKRRSWEALARWSPLGLSTTAILPYMDDIASLNYEINELQDVVKYQNPGSGPGREDWKQNVMQQWAAVMTRSLRAEHMLRAQAEYANPSDFETRGS